MPLDDQEVTLETLTSELKQARTEYTELGVTIRPDANIPAQNLANVFMACRDAGVGNLGFSVKRLKR